jgi:5'-3' exonuclease
MVHFFNNPKNVSELEDICGRIHNPSRVPNAMEQLLVVLPPQSSALIPMPYRLAMTTLAESNIIDMYPTSYALDYYYKINDWEYKPILPDVDFNRISNEVRRISQIRK